MRAYLGIDLEYIDIQIAISGFGLDKVKSQHLTLYFWDELTVANSKNISEKLNNFIYKTFTLKASKVYAFPSRTEPQLIALKPDSFSSLIKLKKNILQYLELDSTEVFEPHITLYRKHKLDSSFKKSSMFIKKIPEVILKVTNVTLYSSEPDKGLNEYKLLQKVLFD